MSGVSRQHWPRGAFYPRWGKQSLNPTYRQAFILQVEPKVVARLVLEKEKKGELEEEVLELEVDVLKEVVATLEEAAAEANSPAAKKLTRR